LLGATGLETDLDREDIRGLANWDPSVQEKAYSSKVPIKEGGVYFNI